MNFNEKLIELRKKEGLSQEELGNKVGVSRQTISKWELGDSTPELEKLRELSKVFKVSIDELVNNEVFKNNESDGYYRPGYGYGYNYEYKSKKTFHGVPLVHINVGRGKRVAKGIIAIGNIAKGVISIGGISMGVISIGGISLGLLAIGGFAAGLIAFAGLAIGLLMAVAGIAIGTFAIGGVALGFLTLGGCSIGIYSIGGAAIAKNVAIGGYASGHIAIGDKFKGDILFDVKNHLSSQEIENTIIREFPKIPKFVLNVLKTIIY